MTDLAARWGRVSLKPLTDFGPAEWRALHGYFRDRELADWNGASPLRLPEWLFRRVMLDEERSGERHTFGVLDELSQLIGSVELYDLRPSPPGIATTATLGAMIGERRLWGRGYGREAVRAVLQWAFEDRRPPLRRIRLRTFAHNRRAQRAFLAAGFREVGRETQSGHTDVLMEITKEEWHDARPDAGLS